MMALNGEGRPISASSADCLENCPVNILIIAEVSQGPCVLVNATMVPDQRLHYEPTLCSMC